MAAVWDTKLLGSGETPEPLARERPTEGSWLGAAERAVSRGERPYETAGTQCLGGEGVCLGCYYQGWTCARPRKETFLNNIIQVCTHSPHNRCSPYVTREVTRVRSFVQGH